MAYGVKSQKFCCCLPVRLGVFVLSFLQLLSTGAFAALCYYAIIKGNFDEQKFRIVTIVVGVVMTLLFIVSLFGLIGCILRRHSLVRVFSRTLNWLLALNILTGIVSIILLFVAKKEDIINACINGSTDQRVIDACNNFDGYKYATIGLIIFSWTVQFYECVIVARYVNQLQEEREEVWRMSAMKTYTQVPRRDSTEAFVSPPASYPYADNKHSFGSQYASQRV